MEVKNTCGDRTRITSTRCGLLGRCTRIIFSDHGASKFVTYFVYVGAHAVEAARRATTLQLRLQLFHYGFNYFTTASTIPQRLQVFVRDLYRLHAPLTDSVIFYDIQQEGEFLYKVAHASWNPKVRSAESGAQGNQIVLSNQTYETYTGCMECIPHLWILLYFTI